MIAPLQLLSFLLKKKNQGNVPEFDFFGSWPGLTEILIYMQNITTSLNQKDVRYWDLVLSGRTQYCVVQNHFVT